MTNTLEWTDRTIYEHIRLKLIAAGRLPDIVAMTGREFKAACAQLRAEKKLIMLYGVGVWPAREDREGNGFYIDRPFHREGSIGGAPATYFVEKTVGGVKLFDEYMYPDKTVHLTYTLTTNATNVNTDRFQVTLIHELFGKHKGLPGLNEEGTALTGEKIYMDFNYDFNRSSELGFDRIFYYQMKDVWLVGGELINSDITEMKEVNAKMNIGLEPAMDINVEIEE